MNKNTFLKAIFCAAAVFAAAASCTHCDEACEADAAGGEANGSFPEGMYPLEIASISLRAAGGTAQPWGAQTRVAEKTGGTGSVFEEGDVFCVKFEGSDEVGTYRITAAGGVEAVKPVCWRSPSDTGRKVVAWYVSGSNTDTDGTTVTMDISDQTAGPAYVLRAEAANVSYGDGIALTFSHQLAKVCVSLRGTACTGNDNGVTLTYPAAITVNEGKVEPATSGTIAMHKNTDEGWYEALVPAGTIEAGGTPLKVALSDSRAEGGLAGELMLEAGSKYDVTLTIHKQGTTEIDLSTQSEAYTISDDGIYYFTGSGSQPINVDDGSPQIFLADATINNTTGDAISITGGSPTIHVQGTDNSMTGGTPSPASYRSGVAANGIAVSGGATLTIMGSSTADKLTANGGYYRSSSASDITAGAGIGSPVGGSSVGDIVIKNVSVTATGGGGIELYSGGAGIGTSWNCPCGDITIEDAVINATGGPCAAAIGGGSRSYSYGAASGSWPAFGNITILRSTVVATGGKGASAIGFACCYNGGYFSKINTQCGGKITITTGDDLDTFKGRLTLNTNSNFTANQRIGKGQCDSYYTPAFKNTDGAADWEGVVFNDELHPKGIE